MTCSRVGRVPAGPVRPPGSSSWSPSGRWRSSSEGPGGAGCPNLLQRPGSRRSAGRESLIFRASSRRRFRREAPLQQIRTRPRPGSPQEPHPHQRANAPQQRIPARTGDDPPADRRPSLFGFTGPNIDVRSPNTRRPGPDAVQRARAHSGVGAAAIRRRGAAGGRTVGADVEGDQGLTRRLVGPAGGLPGDEDLFPGLGHEVEEGETGP